VGWSAGFQFQRGPVSLGVSYKSAIKHTLNGTVTVAGCSARWPQQWCDQHIASSPRPGRRTLACATPSPRHHMERQVTAAAGPSLTAIRLAAPYNSAIPENYRDSWTYAVGVCGFAANGRCARAWRAI
jgi:long-chain fatty acid transport protein